MNQVTVNHSEQLPYFPSSVHKLDQLKSLKYEFKVHATQNKSEVDELDITLREYKILPSCMGNKFSSNDNKLCTVIIPTNISGSDNIITKKCVENYESNSTSCDFDKNKIETPAERAKKAVDIKIKREKSSRDDLDVTLRGYDATPLCGIRNGDAANEKDLFDVTMRGHMVYDIKKCQEFSNEICLGSKTREMKMIQCILPDMRLSSNQHISRKQNVPLVA